MQKSDLAQQRIVAVLLMSMKGTKNNEEIITNRKMYTCYSEYKQYHQ